MNRIFYALFAAGTVFSCAPDKPKTTENIPAQTQSAPEAVITDPTKGIGAVKSVTLHSPLEQDRIGRGLSIYEMKCSACHKLDDKRFVGPGWKDITKRRKPEWIMNMILNPTEMTQKDPTAKELLATHLTQMTNQNVTQEDARKLLEYLRKIDG